MKKPVTVEELVRDFLLSHHDLGAVSCALDFIWNVQQFQNSHWVRFDTLTPEIQQMMFEKYCQAIGAEVTELLDQTGWKLHELRREPVNKGNITEELVDIFKFLVSVALIFDISWDDFLKEFCAKTLVVEDRWRQELVELSEQTVVFCTDLDDCVADLEPYMATYAEEKVGDKNWRTPAVWEAVKLDFMNEGGFDRLPVVPGAVEVIGAIRAMGCKVAIITSRPYWQIQRLYRDTMGWLRRYGIEYDLLLWGKEKSEIIVKRIHPAKVVAFVEDRDKYAIDLSRIGVPVLLMDTVANREMKDGQFIHRVHNWGEIAEIVRERMSSG